MIIMSRKLVNELNIFSLKNGPKISVRKINYDLDLINKLRGKLLSTCLADKGISVTNFNE